MESDSNERRLSRRMKFPSEQLNLFEYDVIDNSLVVTIQPERIDIYNVSNVLDRTDQEFNHLDFSTVILDVRKVRYADDSAIGAIMVAIDRMRKRRLGGELVIVSDNSVHHKILDLFKAQINIFNTIGDALSYFRNNPDTSLPGKTS